MIRLTHKISVIVLACIIVLNAGTAASMVMGDCSSSVNAGHMDIDHCDGLINFALPMQGCCGGCLDIFCDLFKNPLKDANAALVFSSQDYVQDTNARSGEFWEQNDIRLTAGIWGSQASSTPQKGTIPLYIEHLTLII